MPDNMMTPSDLPIAGADLAAAVQTQIVTMTISAVDQTDGTATVTVVIEDAVENVKRGIVRVWTSGRGGSEFGAPVAIDSDFSVQSGTEIEEIAADADYVVLPDSGGSFVMVADDSQDGTLWFMASVGGTTVTDSVSITGT